MGESALYLEVFGLCIGENPSRQSLSQPTADSSLCTREPFLSDLQRLRRLKKGGALVGFSISRPTAMRSEPCVASDRAVYELGGALAGL
jgi:hypothetical protein